MTLGQVVECWRNRAENPLWVYGRPRNWRVYALSMVVLSCLFGLLLWRIDTEYAAILVMAAICLYPSLGLVVIRLTACRLHGDVELQEFGLTRLSRSEVAFGLVALPGLLLLITPVTVGLGWAVHASREFRYTLDEALAFGVFFGTMLFGGALVSVFRWLSDPSATISRFLWANLEYALRVAAAIPLFLFFVSLSIWLLSGRAEKTAACIGILSCCVVVCVYTILDKLEHVELHLYRRVDPTTWAATRWIASERSFSPMAPACRQLVFALLLGLAVYPITVLVIVVLGSSVLLKDFGGYNFPFGVTRPYPSLLISYHSWVLLSVMLPAILCMLLRRLLGDRLLVPGHLLASLLLITAGCLPPFAIHAAICVGFDAQMSGADYRAISDDEIFQICLVSLACVPVMATVVAGMAARRGRRWRCALWLVALVAGSAIFVSDLRPGDFSQTLFPRGGEGIWLLAFFVFALGGYGVVSWIPRLLQQYWLEQRASQQSDAPP